MFAVLWHMRRKLEEHPETLCFFRHLYGREGSRVVAPRPTCDALRAMQRAPGRFHGCPFDAPVFEGVVHHDIESAPVPFGSPNDFAAAVFEVCAPSTAPN